MKRRASSKDNVQRINFAHTQLIKGVSRKEIIRVILKKYNVSLRQAQRYLSAAQELTLPKVVPESKRVLTVSLPVSLITIIRSMAKDIGIPLSELVRTALESFIKTRESRGEKSHSEKS